MASPGPSGNKLSEMLRAGSQPGSAQQYHDEMQSQQQRMAVMAAAVSAGKDRRTAIYSYSGSIDRSTGSVQRIVAIETLVSARRQGRRYRSLIETRRVTTLHLKHTYASRSFYTTVADKL